MAKLAAPLPARRANRRGAARLAAVQALYQMEVSSAGAEAVIREFGEHRFDRDVEDMTLAGADEAFFAMARKHVRLRPWVYQASGSASIPTLQPSALR